MFDVLIIGGGVSGVSCALVLGSAYKKPFASDKKIGIFIKNQAMRNFIAVFIGRVRTDNQNKICFRYEDGQLFGIKHIHSSFNFFILFSISAV